MIGNPGSDFFDGWDQCEIDAYYRDPEVKGLIQHTENVRKHKEEIERNVGWFFKYKAGIRAIFEDIENGKDKE